LQAAVNVDIYRRGADQPGAPSTSRSENPNAKGHAVYFFGLVLLRVCVNADPETDLTAVVDLGSLSNLAAVLATFGDVCSVFFVGMDVPLSVRIRRARKLRM